MRPCLTSLALIALLSLSVGGVLAQDASGTATAQLISSGGQVVGSATFTQLQTGVRVQVQVNDQIPGAKGIHIHEFGRCDAPEFLTAGEHFNPTARQHGFNNPSGAHAGDMISPPNIFIGENRAGSLDVTSTAFTLGPGPTSIMDADGSALMIHAQADDNSTDPAGNTGHRVACGVISLQPVVLSAGQAAAPAQPVAQPTPSLLPATGDGRPEGWLFIAVGILLLTGGVVLYRQKAPSRK